MILSRALPGLLFVIASAAAAATPDREQELARATAQRDELVAERARLADAARAAADRMAATGAPAARAGSALSKQLREFDRLAHGLDDVERRLAEQERRRVRARAAFDAAADGEERRLQERARTEGAAAVAAEMAALAAARRRVAQSEGSSVFRPPLEVALDPLDGTADVEAKLAILQSEEARVGRRLAELAGEASLLATRVAARQEWARELGAARRDAAGAIDLLDRGDEDVRASLRALDARGEEIARERARLAAALARLAAGRAQAEERLAELRKGR
jgi:chromosome segregation ATPase